MTIRELFDRPGVHLSCEVFPPKVFDKVEEAKAALYTAQKDKIYWEEVKINEDH